MTPSSTYSLAKPPFWNPLGWGRARLVADGKRLPVLVNGDDIELQLRCGELTVLATDYDYFDACNHWIYLLDKDGRPVDQLRMRTQIGFLRELEVRSPCEIAFGYFGTHDRWRLVVHPAGFCSFGLLAMLRRPNRFLLSRRYLSVQRTKGPPWS